ncbi:MAG: polysaccharide pyruvyl transferase family protein [Limnobacter sp.]|uniref:polysaccharide pyruvyl transferase family protein n=1 Tax=Limnobacter sp. TaxID=2003368 RepID=UPI004037EA40
MIGEISRCTEFKSFEAVLRKYSNNKIFYIEYPGNSGDILIELGVKKILAESNCNLIASLNEADLMLYPGGNPSMWAEDISKLIEVLEKTTLPIIFGPCTSFKSKMWESFLHKYSNRILHLSVRDIQSFKHLEEFKNINGLNILTSTNIDPAFHLTRDDLMCFIDDGAPSELNHILISLRADHEFKPMPVIFKNLIKWNSIIKRVVKKIHWNYCLFVRTILTRKIKRKLDVNASVEIVDAASLHFRDFVRCINRAKVVHTNRLHVMILALIMEKEIHIYETSYGKLESILHSYKLTHKVRAGNV